MSIKAKKMLSAVFSILILIGAVLFVRQSIQLYRQKQAIEAQLAARDAAGNAGGSGQNGANPDGSLSSGPDGVNPDGGLSSGSDGANPDGSSPAGPGGENGPAPEEEEPPTLAEEYQKDGVSYEKNPNIRTTLILGIDSPGPFKETLSGRGGQSDAIFLVLQDVTTKQIKLLNIPRDTITPVRLYDLAGNYLGKGQRQLTLAYAYGDGLDQSCRQTAEAVSQLLGGVEIQDYLAMTIGALPILNDRAGGVTVTIDDPYLEERNPSLKYGTQVTLKGKEAEEFIRIRNIKEDNTALTRMNRHTTYLKAWMAAARQTSAKNDAFVPELMEEIQQYMITSMPKDRYLKLGLEFLQQGSLSDEDIMTLPGTPNQGLLHDEYLPDAEGIEELVRTLYYRPVH
ncbi:MAG: LCP family protein [Lachnospiraceae bacterium]|nr:LCP family protein [Lachnospiraceae bacterium]